MKLTDFNESFKHYKVKHKKTGKEYKVTAMHDKSALEKARAQHGGTASRYTGTGTSDFEIVEGKKKQVKANSKKPKLIKPNTGHESPHPYRGKLVGEQKNKMPKQSNPVAKHSRNKSGAGAHKSIKDYDRKKEKQELKKMNFDEGEFIASKSAVIDSILRQLKDEAYEDDKLLRHLAKLVKKDAKPRFHNKPDGRFQLSPLEEEMKNVWEVRQIMTEEEFDEAAGKKDACYHKVKSRYKVWPSAYASGALVQCRKKGAANWGNSKKKKKKK
tara:strand:- start:88 stop:900 length:813 start_codon:yes stop_codon:yes gene_type:complete